MKNVLSLLKFSSVFTIAALALTATSVALGQKAELKQQRRAGHKTAG